jgi:hypothetical protein
MLETQKFDTNKEYATYSPSSEESILLAYVQKRFNAMRSARTAVDVNRPMYQSMLDAVLKPYWDERSSSNVPLASAIIELFVADAIKVPTEFNFKAETEEYKTQARVLEFVWKYDRRKNKRKKEFTKSEYVAAAFWTAVIYTGYEQYSIDQKDMIVWEDGEITWEKKTIEKKKIIAKCVDINNFRVDNEATDGIDDANDCYFRQWMWFENFQSLSNNKVYKNVDKVAPRQYSNEYKTAISQEDAQKQGDFVLLEHYWNLEKDAYVVVANGIIIREHPIMSTINGEKALPFTIRWLGYKNNSIYYRGLCEALVMFNSEINNLRELAMDWIRRSNTSVLALWKGLSFDGRWFSYNNEILTFDGSLDSSNFQQISGTPPNQALFNYFDRLYKDIAVYVWVDIQNIIGTPQQTAFQTNVQHEASQKRINAWLTNRDLSYERFADLHKDNLQRFFPLKDAQGLYPKIQMENAQEVGGKIRDKKGLYMLEVTPEKLQGDIYVDVYTNTTAPTINAVAIQQKMEFAQAIPAIVNWYVAAKQAWFDLDKTIPMKWFITELAEGNNIDIVSEQSGWDVKEAKKKLTDRLLAMQWGGQPPVEWALENTLSTPQEWATNML